MSWNEDAIHRALGRAPRPRGLAGSRGHDAAVLRALAGKPVLCVDACVERIHFEPDTRPELVGRKACARAISDLAATAAAPKAVLLAISAARARTDAWILHAIDGVRATAREHGADLVGGDLGSTTGPTVMAVTALGDFDSRREPPGRDRARPGQVVFLTGPCGGSILGRHLAIEPRVAAGRWLHARGATAIMDVSDGLAWDLHRLARASGVRIEIDMAALPIHADARRLARKTRAQAWEHALHDGEDHELVATLPASALARVQREAHRHVGHAGSAAIGRVVRGSGVLLKFADREIVWQPAMGGWKHGG
jgi:thiamine-monophosphate kinase